MLYNVRDYLKRFDYGLILLFTILTMIGYFAIYSAVYDPSTGTVQAHAYAHLQRFGMGLILFIVVTLIGYKRLVQFAPLIYAFSCIVLLYVLLKGYVGQGSQRWISLGFMSVQPSEFFKVAWVITLAWVFSDYNGNPAGLQVILKKAVVLIIPFILVYKQPDLGTALTYVAVWGIVLLILGIKRYMIVLMVIIMAVSGPLLWHNMKAYQKQRVYTFLNPEKDPSGTGYHVIQSRIAVGSGGLVGKGYLKGTQSHLKFIPERHTDFIFSVINEEFGFVGGATITLLFFLLIYRVLYVSALSRDMRGKIICLGVAGYLFFQFFVNAGMTLGMLPVVGIPMPFISYGGSSLFTFLSMMGLANSVYVLRNNDSAR